MRLNTLFILASVLLCLSSCTDLVFVTPVQSCNNNCTGTATSPFDNIFDALEKAATLTSPIIFLLNEASTPHYLLGEEDTVASTSTKLQLQTKEFILSTLILQPLFCNDDIMSSEPTLQGKCIEEDEMITVYLKTTQFKLTIQNSAYLRNIIFDAVEDILHWNTNTDQLKACLFERERCCYRGDQRSSTSIAEDLWCQWQNDAESLPSAQPTNTLFFLDTENTSLAISVEFYNIEFMHFQSAHLMSFIQIENSPFTLLFNQTDMDYMYFSTGFISHLNAGQTPQQSANLSSITLVDTTFTNYNPWKIYNSNFLREEGYLFYARESFLGTFTITRSTFTNITNSVRNICWGQTLDNYLLPMNNLLTSQPRSRSDLWNQYHQSLENVEKEFVSSLLFIRSINGALAISSSTFTNVIGTSGSVIRVDDVAASDNWITIYNSKFEDNFAYDKFANVMIAKVTNPTFSAMLECPYIEIVNSNFTSAYGCPGAYGNIFLLCYWDSEPQDTLTQYSLDSAAVNIINNWAFQDENNISSQITVINSIFEKNIMAVSNSLAIIGGSYISLQDNTFQDNGGSTAEIANISLKGSYFLEIYPDAITFPLSLTHFGQSSVVFIDHLLKLYSVNNIYQSNWGGWEGSLALASAVTIKNWARTHNGIIMKGDTFKDHKGVPSSITSHITDTGLANNAYIEPILSLSLDAQGSSAMVTLLSDISSTTPEKVLLYGVSFIENTISFDYTSFSYNSAELSSLTGGVMPFNSRFQSGLIKLLWASEARDDFSKGFSSDTDLLNQVNFAIVGGEITNNEVLTMGCLFSNILFIQNTHIIGNKIYLASETFQEAANFFSFFLITIDTTSQGLVCVGTMDFLGSISRLQLTADNLLIKDNQGIIFNVAPTFTGSFYLSNSAFVNNSCVGLSMIALRQGSSFVSINNMFINNSNSLGTSFSFLISASSHIYNTYLKNDGKYGCVKYIESLYTAFLFEGMAKIYWNTLSPKYKTDPTGRMTYGSLIVASNSLINFFGSEFRENTCYSGVVAGLKSTYIFTDCEFTNHYLVGSALIGPLISARNFIMQNIKMVNNTLMKDPTLPYLKSGLFVFATGAVTMNNIQITDGSVENGAVLIFGNLLTGSITNMNISNFYRNDVGQNPLLYLSLSTLSITNLQSNNTTGLFYLTECTLTLESIVIEDLVAEYDSQYLMNSFDSTLKINGFNYTGDGETDSILPLFEGNKNSMIIRNMNLLNPVEEENIVFDLDSSVSILISESTFSFTKNLVNTTVFSLTAGTSLVIQDCIFSLPGTIVKATDLDEAFYFIENTIITNSHIQSIALEDTAANYILHNIIIRQDNDNYASLPVSQIYISDTKGLTRFSENSMFSLYGQTGILQISSEEYPYEVEINSNLFIDNTASRGGALYLGVQKMWETDIIPTAIIENSIFLKNKAVTLNEHIGKAGALYLQTSNQDKQNTAITKSVFIENKADQAGGAIYFEYSLPSITTDSTFIENYDTQLNHISSYPVRLFLLPNDSYPNEVYLPGTDLPIHIISEQFDKWDNIASSVGSGQNHNFILVDMFDQMVDDDNTSTLDLYPTGFSNTKRYLFSNKLSIQAENGIYKLSNFTFTYKTGQSLNVSFRSSAIEDFTILPVPGITISPNFTVEVSFRECGMGEFLVVSGDLTGCKECPTDYWQVGLSATASVCKACDSESTFCFGGANVGPRPGYWRMNTTADILVQCPTDACIGNTGVDPTDENANVDPVTTCKENHVGNLCDSCIEGWAQGSGGNCIDCQTTSIHYILLTVALLFQAGLIAYGVKETLNFGDDFTKNDQVETNSATLFRIMLNYFQTATLLINIPVTWPIELSNAVSTTSKISAIGDKFFPVNCFFLVGEEKLGVRSVFLEGLFSAVMPFFYVTLAIAAWTIFFLLKKRPIRSKTFANYLITTVVIICFDTQPDVIQSSFSLLQCQNLYREDTPLTYMIQDYDVKCWEGEHLKWALGLALPSLLIWIVALPGILLIILWKNQKDLQTEDVARKYCFIYNGYKDDRYYWEFLMMTRKILLICVIVFAGLHSINMQVYLSGLIVFFAFVLQSLNEPYSNIALNNLERVSVSCLCAIALCGIYFQDAEGQSVLNMCFMVLGIGGNIYFIFYFLRMFFALQVEKIRENERLMKILKYINAKCCCCLKVRPAKYLLKTMNRRINKVSGQFKRDSVSIATSPVGASLSKNTLMAFSHQGGLFSPRSPGMAGKQDVSFSKSSFSPLKANSNFVEREDSPFQKSLFSPSQANSNLIEREDCVFPKGSDTSPFASADSTPLVETRTVQYLSEGQETTQIWAIKKLNTIKEMTEEV